VASRLRKSRLPFSWNAITAAFTQGVQSTVNLRDFVSNTQSRTLTYSALSALPTGVTLSGSVLTYNGTSPAGSTLAQFRVTDGLYTAESAATTVSIATPTNQLAPVWTAIPVLSLTPGQLVSIAQYASDPEGGALTFAKVSGDSRIVVSTNGAVSASDLTAVGSTYPFTVSVTDVQGLSATQPASVQVIAPVARLSGPTTAPVNASVNYTVAFDFEAQDNYTVSWFKDGVPAGQTELLAGTFSTSLAVSWPSAGTKSLFFAISPFATEAGTPITVTVGAALPVTTATLAVPATAITGQPALGTVFLDQPAEQTYVITWTAASGAPSSGSFEIPVGSLSGTFTTQWAAAHAGRSVAFNISPTTNSAAATITKIGSPKNVPVVAATADTPTIATLTGRTTAELERWNIYTVELDKPADRQFRVNFRQTGAARLYWSSFTIPPGERFAWTMAKWEGDEKTSDSPTSGSVDFTISPSITRAGGPTNVTISGDGEPLPSAAFLTGNGMVQAGIKRPYTVRLDATAEQDYTVTVSATGGATVANATVVIPTGWMTAETTTEITWPAGSAAETVSFTISPAVNTAATTIDKVKNDRSIRVLPAFTVEMNTRVITDIDRVLQFETVNGTGKYTRAVPNSWLSNVAVGRVQFNVAAYAGNNPTFQASNYELWCYLNGDPSTLHPLPLGNKLVTAGVTAGRQEMTNVDLTAIPSGWHLFDIRPTTPTQETCAMHWIYVGDASAWYFKEWVPFQSGSWPINHEDRGNFRWGRVPAFIDPPTFTVPIPATPTFDYAADKADLFRRNLVAPCVNGDVSYPRVMDTRLKPGYPRRDVLAPSGVMDGVRSTFSVQGYSFNSLAVEYPSIVPRDGAFGVGTIAMLTHAEIGTAAPTNADGSPIIIENRYFTDAWSMGKIRRNGDVKRLAGYRHDELAGLILLGDWSRIEGVGKKTGFHETWGLAWDERTFASNADHPRIPGERNLNPHYTGVQAFVTDSQNHRVLSLKFDRYAHDSPPIVEVFHEFLDDAGRYSPAGLPNAADSDIGLGSDPWDCTAYQGVLYVSERMRNRVSMWDIDTKAYLGNLIEGPTYQPTGFYAGYGNIGYVRTDDHWVRRTFTKASGYGSSWTLWQAVPAYVRSPDIIMPEGLYRMDNWLYIGSVVTGCVKRVNLDDPSEIEIPFMFQTDTDIANSLYCKVTVSDGTFGPRHTVFASTWEKNIHSLPYTRVPPTTAQKAAGEPGDVWSMSNTGVVNEGRGPNWNALGYTTGVGQHNGRLLVATADYGMFEISLAASGDTALDEVRYANGARLYNTSGKRFTHGIDGYRPWKSLPLPWGQHADLDYWLTATYHTTGED
jgi:hypothetical protein